MTDASHLRRLAAIALLAALPFAGCDSPAPAAEERLLVVDGIEVKLGDVTPYVEFLDSFLPEIGRKTKFMRVLDEHVLPLCAGRRVFAAERKEQLARAQGLCSVATNVAELEAQTQLVKDKTRKDLTRLKAMLPVAMFLFDPLKLGSVSEPIEVPFGYLVVGCFDMKTGPLVVADYVDALQVGFLTHSAGDWYQWFEGEKQRLAAKVTFVHPDYRDAIPQWLTLPQRP